QQIVKCVVDNVDTDLRTRCAVDYEASTHIENYIVSDNKVLNSTRACNHRCLKAPGSVQLRNAACVSFVHNIDRSRVLRNLQTIDMGITVFRVSDQDIVDEVPTDGQPHSINVYTIRIDPARNVRPS